MVLHFSGQISIQDLWQATIEYEGDPRFDTLLFVIADYSRIDGCSANPAEIEDVWVMDEGAKISNPRIRKAIVTTCSEVAMLADYYKNNLAPAFPVKTFAAQAAARDWLKTG